MITSLQSPSVKRFNRLKQRKYREKEGLFLVEGTHLVDEALRAGLLEKVIYSGRFLKRPEGKELMGRLIAEGVDMEEAGEKIIDLLSEVETPQGIVAASRAGQRDLGDLFENDDPFIVVACDLQDPGNLGTLIRTAEATGASGIILAGNTVDAYNDKVIRASSGSIFRLKMVRFDDIIQLVSSLKRRGIKVVSAFADGETCVFDADLRVGVAVFIGSEGSGLPQELKRLSDSSVFVPMAGKTESLNAAVTGAVIMYEAMKQRGIDAGKAR